ncbi:penicillin-binding protein activator LpoB [bacterium]|nr:penicillin-binding protein activator LpoB [bacterium]
MKKLVLLLVLVSFLSISCGSTGKTKRVNRIDSAEEVDLSGDWNDTDSQLVSKEMINQMIGEPWLAKAKSKKEGKEPTVIVGKVKNKSNEHISTETFVKDLQKALIGSGEVEFVSDKKTRSDLREEVEDQTMNSSDDTMKGPGKEEGADYMLIGQINTISDRSGGTSLKYYQVELELHELGTNKIVWMGQKKIKKVVKQKKRTW